MRYDQDHKERTRRRILDAAGRIFRRRGYTGAGVDGLMAEAGLTSGAFYGHFRSKEALLEAVVREAVARAESVREAGLEDLEGRPRAVAMLRRYLSRGHRDAVEVGCIVPTLVSELSRAGSGPQQAFAGSVEELVDRLAGLLGDGDEARRRALAALAMAVGGVALARAVGDARISDEVLAACAGDGLDALLGGATS